MILFSCCVIKLFQGMDIDNIRIVVRYDLPPSLSEFCQVQMISLVPGILRICEKESVLSNFSCHMGWVAL